MAHWLVKSEPNKYAFADLQNDLPKLKTFATLSPLPGFRRWLDAALSSEPALLTDADMVKLAAASGRAPAGTTLAGALAQADWPADTRLAEALAR